MLFQYAGAFVVPNTVIPPFERHFPELFTEGKAICLCLLFISDGVYAPKKGWYTQASECHFDLQTAYQVIFANWAFRFFP